MLETAEWIREYFNQAPNAILLFKNDELLISNRPAQRLISLFRVNPDYLLQVSKNAWEQQKGDDCANCAIKSKMTDVTVPIIFHANSTPAHYSLIYKPLNRQQDIFSITIENREHQGRISQVEQQRTLNQYINEAHEKERQKISQDLHDSVAQGIYSAIMGINRLSKQSNLTEQEVQQLGQNLEDQLRATLGEIKRMALDIRPSVLDNFGLIPAIKALAKRTQASTGIKINVISSVSEVKLPANIQNVLYRISQESINNAIKHAAPSEINIIITKHNNYFQLEVLDNGKGFDTSKNKEFNGHSLGLMNMNERVKGFNGAFSIKSKINAGTSVQVRFPYNDVNKDMVN
ncbi:sensor histidine kinase [Limosilactobacillus sp. STM2_1]|uniref:Sensor histidine kinase n=1 Tax=Limosilactobacillus rudii TaxID=2759755 RepID=A0A7W3UMC4_9LACO|nr:sensor histidine kinase [Limosilactobacillus rudii]MBB1078891.1 sensor histidine kinase [Limosilactobacillus rudii]MBB1098233.1 sensor histidine kinase [Limosilactobacillus rudii]MCD7135652.1 sensor histidine kinase [Limosilactobacillus rudii]